MVFSFKIVTSLRVCQVSGSRAVNRRVVMFQRWQAQTGSRERCNIRKDRKETREKKTNRRPDKQQATGRAIKTKANRIKIKWHHQKRMSREKGERDMSRTKNPRDHAVNGRDNRAVWFPSYRLSLFFFRLPPFVTSVTRIARALLVLNSY